MVNVSDTVRGLQARIRIMSNFCERTDMRVNLSKTKGVVFRNVVSLRNMKGGISTAGLLKLYWHISIWGCI